MFRPVPSRPLLGVSHVPRIHFGFEVVKLIGAASTARETLEGDPGRAKHQRHSGSGQETLHDLRNFFSFVLVSTFEPLAVCKRADGT